MLSNPPYGKSWKTDQDRMGGAKGIRDPRFVVEHAGDPEFSLVTRSSDGQVMFLANLADIGKDHRERTFAIIIDEAHSSQGGKTTAAVSMALAAGGAAEEDETIEDTINRIIESKKMLPNASYFAFTATPKNKTLQMFGEPVPGAEGTAYRPFHSYTMKQATQERFIVDVLENSRPCGATTSS
jgi:type I site-specific restriction-modification system R (restriction) subunit